MMHEFWMEFWLLGGLGVLAIPVGAASLAWRADRLYAILIRRDVTADSARQIVEWLYRPCYWP